MDYDDENVFAKVLRGEIRVTIVHEDEHCLAFRDIDPKAPTHVLLIPKRSIARVADAAPADAALLGHLLWAAGEVARAEGCADAFRLVINNGAGAGQSVFHLHVHLLGGRALGWPPG